MTTHSQQPLFSIATPCFNSAKTIERTFKSILAQEFKDYEYIVVDGGSTDGTIDIIKRYEPLFEGRMRWKSEPDKGLYDAFNKGVERSNGRYCWNVNSDDYIEPDALEMIAEYISVKNYSNLPILSCGMNFVGQEGNVIRKILPDKETIRKGFKKDFIGSPHPAMIVPKDIYDRNGMFDISFKIMGDLDWFHRVYSAGEKFEVLKIIVTNMTQGGISTTYEFKKFMYEKWQYLNKHYKGNGVKFVRFAKSVFSFCYLKIRHSIINFRNF